ncbi:MAG: hypothetical protein ACEY3J_03435 [Arsenophonus sp.]
MPQQTIHTAIGDVEIKVTKVMVEDRSGSKICFNSSLLLPYLNDAKNIKELPQWVYLRGMFALIFTNPFGIIVENTYFMSNCHSTIRILK